MSTCCHCYDCGQVVEGGQIECPNCLSPFTAPECPSCGQPVSNKAPEIDSFNRSAWNNDWRGCCAHCGHEFRSESTLFTGHCSFAEQMATNAKAPEEMFAGRSLLSISTSDSRYLEIDSWDSCPTIEIAVQRRTGGNLGEEEHRLQQQARIVLTVTECLEIVKQLQGPLRVLLRQQPSWRDLT